MSKNTLLNIAISISSLSKILIIALVAGLTFMFVYTQIDNTVLADKTIKLNNNISFLGFYINEVDALKNIENPYTFGQLKTVSLYITYFKTLMISVLVFMSVNAFQKITISIKNSETFSANNSKLFKNIGVYIIGIVIIASYSVMRFESATQFRLEISLTYLIYALLAFIMAEIFKKENALKQEKGLIV